MANLATALLEKGLKALSDVKFSRLFSSRGRYSEFPKVWRLSASMRSNQLFSSSKRGSLLTEGPVATSKPSGKKAKTMDKLNTDIVERELKDLSESVKHLHRVTDKVISKKADLKDAEESLKEIEEQLKGETGEAKADLEKQKEIWIARKASAEKELASDDVKNLPGWGKKAKELLDKIATELAKPVL
jgi:hypothetical protein